MVSVPWIREPEPMKILTYGYENKVYHIVLDKGYFWFPAREWLPGLQYSSYRETLKKTKSEFKLVYKIPVKQGQSNHSSIRHDKFFKMVRNNKKVESQQFRSWILDEVLPMLGLKEINKKVPRKIVQKNEIEPEVIPEINDPLTLYYAETREILEGLDIKDSHYLELPKMVKKDLCEPGTILTTTHEDCLKNILNAIRMEFIPAEKFLYIKCFDTGLKLFYTFDQVGEVLKMLPVK